MSGSSCFAPRRAVEIETLTSGNPNIASVDPDTGVITGVAPGEATIIAVTAEPDSFQKTLSVTVLPATTAAK